MRCCRIIEVLRSAKRTKLPFPVLQSMSAFAYDVMRVSEIMSKSLHYLIERSIKTDSASLADFSTSQAFPMKG
jgi:hypothetical protein